MEQNPYFLHWPGGELSLDRCRIVGILNVTPDSFSDGGKYFDPKKAVDRAWQIADEGADVLDIGAESTRPGSEGIDEKTEWSRLASVLQTLAKQNYLLPISLDSTKPDLVFRALEERLVHWVNDVQGLQNPRMREAIREFKVPATLMHMWGMPRTMQSDYRYEDVVEDLIVFFRRRLEEMGSTDNLVIDPGIGFGKGVEHNLQLLNRLHEFKVLNVPVLVGASRKSFIGKILGTEVDDRVEGSLAAAVIARDGGASLLRVHDVRATSRAIRMAEAIRCS